MARLIIIVTYYIHVFYIFDVRYNASNEQIWITILNPKQKNG